MKIRDWRGADPGLLRACYAAERLHWGRELAWETSWTWSTVERARTTWGLPGLIALDERERPLGWAFYMIDGSRLNIGGLVASDAGVTAPLVDRMLADAAEDTDLASCFILDRAPGLTAALETRGFDIERFQYLARPLEIAQSPVRAASRRPDIAALAPLLHVSYTAESARHFAPGGTLDAWTQYLNGLIHQRGCGIFDPSATCVVGDDRGLQGAALVTSVSATTAHLAQLAVRPDCRGRGLAGKLLEEATTRAAQAGKSEMTLIVSEHNLAARRLYDSAGFRARALFIAADRGVSAYCSAGAASSANRAAS